jgi:hypothetical protein
MDENNSKINKNDKKTKYPISVKGYQCIGPCYPTNTHIRHPITLNDLYDDKYNICPTDGYVKFDSKTGKSHIVFSDHCYVPTIAKETDSKYIDEKTKEMIVTPKFNFSSDFFIKIYYNIKNLEDLLSWLDKHDKDPYRTKERVFNNGMIVYSEGMNIIDNRLVKFVDQIMVKNLSKIIRHVHMYFVINNNKINLTIPNNNDKKMNLTKEQISILRSYLKDNFFGLNNIQTFLSKMIRYYKDDFKQKELSKIMVNHMIEYIIKKISVSLDTENDKKNNNLSK